MYGARKINKLVLELEDNILDEIISQENPLNFKEKVSPDDETREDIIYKVLGENYNSYKSLTERKIYIDEKTFPASEDKFLRAKSEKFNIERIKGISEELQHYLSTGEGNIDLIYSKILKEYLRTNSKAKPKYNEENYNTINIRGKRSTIKPKLPQDDEQIIKRATRKDEDIAYKIIKIGVLCNKFAHYTQEVLKNMLGENIEGIDQILFDLKNNIIKKVIEKSKNNKNISIGINYDVKGTGIVMDIPYYATIMLHIPEKDKGFVNYLENNLQDYCFLNYSAGKNINQELNPAIMIDGVNIETFEKLRNIQSISERVGIITSMSNEALHKMLIRLGYTSKDFASREGRTRIIQNICSDEGLDKIQYKLNSGEIITKQIDNKEFSTEVDLEDGEILVYSFSFFLSNELSII